MHFYLYTFQKKDFSFSSSKISQFSFLAIGQILRCRPIQSGSVGDLYSKLSLFKSDINVRIIIFYCNGCISYEILILRFKTHAEFLFTKD